MSRQMEENDNLDNHMWHQIGGFGEALLQRRGKNLDAYNTYGGLDAQEATTEEVAPKPSERFVATSPAGAND